MPDGIVAVTDDYTPDGITKSYYSTTSDYKALYDKVFRELSRSMDSKYFTTSSTSTSIPSTWFTEGTIERALGGATASGIYVYPSHPKKFTYDENPTAWEDPVVEYDPDPESIYGKALARARAKK